MVNLLLSEPTLTGLMNYIESTLGLHLPVNKWNDLERALLSVYRELGYKDIGSLAERIIKNELTRPELESLAAALTVGETYFFREVNSLKAFEYSILPELVKKGEMHGKRLRIWSAGCATGEEPYTIAMIIKNNIPVIEDWDITILATDINIKFIQKALTGVYTKWSFRDLPQWIINKYFIQKNGNLFEINAGIKKMVTFNYLNLMENNYPSILNDTNAMNVIFCRNVLMYFSEDNIKKVVRKFNSSLEEGGYLIVSQTELSEFYFTDFRTFPSTGAILYKKDSSRKTESENIAPVRPAAFISMNGTVKETDAGQSSESEHAMHLDKSAPVKSELKTPMVDTPETIKKMYDSGEYDEAAASLLKIISDGYGNSGTLALLARVYANMGMLGEAEKFCIEAVNLDNMNHSYQFLLASIYIETGNTEGALSALRRAIYMNPEFIMAYYISGIINLGRNNRDEAEKNLDSALQLLSGYNSGDEIPESEGIPADRLSGIIKSLKKRMENGF